MSVEMGGMGAIAGVQSNSNIDIEMFMMQISAERANNLESQMKDQVNEVKARQDAIGKLTKFLNDLSGAIKGKKDGDDIKMNDLGLTTKYDPDCKDGWSALLEKFGCTYKSGQITSDGHAKKETIEGWMEQLKGGIDALNSQGQLDMIRLQSIMNKRNESFEQMTNMMQKFNKARESIVGNLR